MTESFPRQDARTRRFTLGVPRAFRVSPDGARVAFLRTQGGGDPVTCLWVLAAAAGTGRRGALRVGAERPDGPGAVGRGPGAAGRRGAEKRREGGPAAGGAPPPGTGQ